MFCFKVLPNNPVCLHWGLIVLVMIMENYFCSEHNPNLISNISAHTLPNWGATMLEDGKCSN